MKYPKVSIVIPVYNGANYLSEAIESALAQTYPNFEVIVINDGSNDAGATEKIAKSYGRKIRYFKKPNGGVATALNLGIKKMRGEYFSWLSHDDLYYPQKLQSQIDFIQKCPPKTLVYSNFEVIDRLGRHIIASQLKAIPKAEFLPLLIKKRFIQGCSLLIPKSVFVGEGVFNERLRNTQDYDLWFRLKLRHYSFRLCPALLVKSRQHNEQTSLKTGKVQRLEEDNLYFRLLHQFSSEQLIPPRQSLGLGYLNFAISLQILGLVESANYASVLSRQYLLKKDYPVWFIHYLYYLFWRLIFSRFFNFSLQIIRRLKRMFWLKPAETNVQRSSLKTKIRFCLIGNIISPHNQKLIDFLRNQNYDIHFISTYKGRVSGINNYDISRRRFEPKFWWFLRTIFTVRKLVCQIQPNLIQGQYLISGGILAYFSGFRPYVIGVFGSDVLESQPLVFKYLIKKILQNAALIIGSSLVLKQAAVAIGAEPTKFHLVRFGIDLDIFKPSGSRHLRQKLGLKDEKVIFSPRVIQPIYNIKVLVEAFALLANQGKFKLALLNQPIDKFYLKGIKNYIATHRLEEKVFFLPPVPNSKMADYYNLAELVVSIPHSDSAAVSFLEAMACEKKIVVSNLPFLKEWQRGQNFWRSEIKSDKLGKTLLLALNKPVKEFAAIGRLNRQLVRRKANLKTCFSKLNKLYHQIIPTV